MSRAELSSALRILCESAASHGADLPARAAWSRRSKNAVYSYAQLAQAPAWDIVAYRVVHGNADAKGAVTERMRSDSSISRHLDQRVGNIESGHVITADSCMVSFVKELLERQGAVVFSLEIFEKLLAEFFRFFDSPTIAHRYVAPLTGVAMSVDTYPIAETYLIQLDDATWAGVMEGVERPLPSSIVMNAECAMLCVIEVEKVVGEPTITDGTPRPSSGAQAWFEELCAIARLVVGGVVQFDEIHVWPDEWQPISTRRKLTKQILLRKSQPRHVAEDELRRMGETIQRFRTLEKSSPVVPAMRRFNYGCDRDRPEDRFVDHLIAFEALLLGDGNQELGYKLAHRGAALIGDTPKARQYAFDLLKTAYRERSNIVHGKPPRTQIAIGGKHVEFRELASEIEDNLRVAICRVSELIASSPSVDIIDQLEARILGLEGPSPSTEGNDQTV